MKKGRIDFTAQTFYQPKGWSDELYRVVMRELIKVSVGELPVRRRRKRKR